MAITRRGLELFQQEKYGAAQEKFRQSIAGINGAGWSGDHLLLVNSYYYDALCSKNLQRPDAEKLFLDVTEKFEENPTTRLAYFHLGDIYFDLKKYDKAITSYKKVDPYDLTQWKKQNTNSSSHSVICTKRILTKLENCSTM
jgi:tetratricopeptide (TPR) repeat protein